MQVLAIILVMLVERVIGIPMLSIILTSLFCSRLNQVWRYGLLLVSSLIIAALFMLPLSRVVMILGASLLWLNYGKSIVASRFIRLILAGAGGAVVLMFSSYGGVHWQYLIYVFIVTIISFLGLKRRKLSL